MQAEQRRVLGEDINLHPHARTPAAELLVLL